MTKGFSNFPFSQGSAPQGTTGYMENGAWINPDLTLVKTRTEARAGSVPCVSAETAHGSGKVGEGRHLLVPKSHLQEPG